MTVQELTNNAAAKLIRADYLEEHGDIDGAARLRESVSFTVGCTYSHRWIGDANLISTYLVLARTRKTVTIKCIETGETSRKTIKRCGEGFEFCKPTGTYSMAPTLRAKGLV